MYLLPPEVLSMTPSDKSLSYVASNFIDIAPKKYVKATVFLVDDTSVRYCWMTVRSWGRHWKYDEHNFVFSYISCFRINLSCSRKVDGKLSLEILHEIYISKNLSFYHLRQVSILSTYWQAFTLMTCNNHVLVNSTQNMLTAGKRLYGLFICGMVSRWLEVHM